MQSLKELHPEMAAIWKLFDYGVVHVNVNGMTSIVMQCPRQDAELWRGVKVMAQLELHRRKTAPVFRLHMKFQEGGGNYFNFETFFDINKPEDKENLRLLSVQDELIFHFFESGSQDYIYSKTINWRQQQRQETANMLKQGERELSRIEHFDFMKARAEVEKLYPI